MNKDKVIPNLSMIAAIGKNNELGRNNDLIWRFKEDLHFFKNTTMGKPMVMGYNTFFSLRGGKPLPGRTHIVLTKNRGSSIEENPQIIIVNNEQDLLDYINTYKDEIMVIGGAMVYSKMIEYANKLIITRVLDQCKEADVFFPPIIEDEWNSEIIGENTENEISYQRLIYTRK